MDFASAWISTHAGLRYTKTMLPFSPLTSAWFASKFEEPTEVQSLAWREIARGRHTLVCAPTGSGKTFAAFLHAVDKLVVAAESGALCDRTYVIYVSPLKALSNDIQKNLVEPLAGIRALAEARGISLADIRVAVRTGDTPQKERALHKKKPPHIFITTPESLYILLTASSSREIVRHADTIIVDEIHAMLSDKRGSHLALSLERLDLLAQKPLTRVGLSATQKPMEEVARFLVGEKNVNEAREPACTIVNAGHRRRLDMSIVVPSFELGPIPTHETRDSMHRAILDVVASHKATIVFCHTRRLVERTARALSDVLGAERVAAHHGSLSKDTRWDAENKLKSGAVSVIVASASLELGIDVGHVDVVVHVGAPRSIASLLQRVGRSGHFKGATPKGVLLPLTRDDLVQCAAAIHAVRTGDLDALSLGVAPLDILSQQIVATAASENEITTEALFALIRGAYPFRGVTRETFDEVLTMLSDGITTRRGRRGALVHHDRVNGVVRARRGSRLAAITGGGAIPDMADYEVVEDATGHVIGKIHEDFAIESMAGDVFLLGNHPWKIRRVEKSRVRVLDASGQAPTLPFWLGEAPARTKELSSAVSSLRARVAKSPTKQASLWLMNETSAPEYAAEQIVEYMRSAVAALGEMPTPVSLVAERFFDEAGGMQLIVHAPLGGRINRALGLLLRKRFCRSFDFELQAAATDDGVLLSLGEQHSFPLETIFSLLYEEHLEEDLVQAVLVSPMFENRFRWNATRSLALLRHNGGKRVPMPIQRMRAQDLLSAVFPAQTACGDNHGGGPIEIPDHPLVEETIANCLNEALDIEGLRALVVALKSGAVKTMSVETPAPSPLSHEILSSSPYTFLDDAPLEERRARAVSLRRTDPDVAQGVGALDANVIREVCERAWPHPRDADEAHDDLYSLVVWPEREATASLAHLDVLTQDGRAFCAETAAGRVFVATERALFFGAIADRAKIPAQTLDTANRLALITPTRELALSAYVGGFVAVSGPITSEQIALRLGLDLLDVDQAIATLEQDGLLLRGSFTPGSSTPEVCDRRLLSQIHRGTIGRLRSAIEPVEPADLMRFLFAWQHVAPGGKLHGRDGVRKAIESLAGVEVPGPAWEKSVLPARVENYEPSFLESLCLSGEVSWGRLTPQTQSDADLDADLDVEDPKRSTRRTIPTRAAPLAFFPREDADTLLLPADIEHAKEISELAKQAYFKLETRGALFLSDIARECGTVPSEAENALWELVSAGLVTGDGVAGLRTLLMPEEKRAPSFASRASRAARSTRMAHLRPVDGGRARALPVGRWSLLPRDAAAHADAPARVHAWCTRLLSRYGVLLRELCMKEKSAPPWRVLSGELRRMEARGEIRGGRFVSGFAGEQFALPHAVEILRSVKRRADDGTPIIIAAADPLNLVGIITQGARVSSLSGNMIAYERGVPVHVGSLAEIRLKTGMIR